ncbi:hypothetical protein J3R82DRAFT_5783 [Butyriboletus roseoflavus]|nr:hypothetical protein J3R82DRAFT_5783 [Butyriboletus roseoflavus]
MLVIITDAHPLGSEFRQPISVPPSFSSFVRMPSASFQSRIQAFEALSSSSSTMMSATTPSLSTPTVDNPSNLLESPISPTANAFHPITPFVALTSTRSRSPSPSTPSLAGQTSLTDLKDWIVEDGPVERPTTFRHTLTSKLNGIRESSSTPPSRQPTPIRGVSNSQTPLINFQSSLKPRPPLPPRRPSFNTTDLVSTQRSVSAGSETGATLRPPCRSDSLMIEHTYPPGAHRFGAGRVGHASASSISSFHSVSLSSDGSNVEVHSPKMSPKPPSFTFEADSSVTDLETASITESFENVSAPSAVSPSTTTSFDWEQAISKSKTSPKREPPGLPNRLGSKTAPVVSPKPLARSVSSSSSSTATSTKTRRPPPPPPPYQPRSRPSSSRASVVSTSASTSDRSSIFSNATTTSRTSISTPNSAHFGGGVTSSPLLRPTPVPPAARSRYESLFNSAVQGRRKAEKKARKVKLLAPPPLPAKKGGQAAGWRDLSVDLIANPDGHPVLSSEKVLDKSDSEEEEESLVALEERLDGRIIKYIWSTSRLDRKKLKSIWSDCDPQDTGFIDREAFVRGMWRIDEELRRAQLARRTSALTAASSQRIPHRPLPPPRPQGTTRLLI